MGKKEKRVILIIVSIIVVLAVLSAVIKYVSAFRYEKHLEDAVVTVDGTPVTLREFGCYIYYMEDFFQQQALVYDPENPKLWWNTHFSAGYDSAFISDYAHRSAIDMCVCTEIYAAEANREGIALDEAESAKAESDATDMFYAMDASQQKATGLSQADIVNVKKKQALAAKYVTYLTTTRDFSAYNDDPHNLLNWDGAYYKDFILSAHKVDENEELLANITFGTITVNQE